MVAVGHDEMFVFEKLNKSRLYELFQVLQHVRGAYEKAPTERVRA
jgi:hypothetical protein